MRSATHAAAASPARRERKTRLPLPRTVAGFVIVFVTVLALGHAWVAKRLVLDAGLDAPTRFLLLAVVGGLGALLVARPLLVRLGGFRDTALLAWPTVLWLGFWWILLSLVAVTDAGTLVWWTATLVLPFPGPEIVDGGPRALALVTLAGLLTFAGGWRALRPAPIRRTEIRIEGWPEALDGYRIVQLTDVHIGHLLGARFAEALTRRVNALEPDLVAVTGDLVDGDVEKLAAEVAPFAGLRGRDGVFFVTGNHDHMSGVDAWVARFGEIGFRVLRNERVTIGKDEASFDLAGVDDHHGRRISRAGGEDLESALGGRDPSRRLVLLAHQPATFPTAARHDIDLQISGHTHGGQIWPFHWVVRLVTPYLAGLYREGRSQLYVSRGTGFWGPPIRLFAPPEIAELVLRRAASAR